MGERGASVVSLVIFSRERLKDKGMDPKGNFFHDIVG